MIAPCIFGLSRKPFCLVSKAFSTLVKKVFDVGQKLYDFIV